MKMSFKTLLVAAATFVTLGATSCSEKQADNAAAATENAAENTGDAVENAADQTGAAVENATDNVKADMAREPGDTAVVVDRPANKVVEETPATQK